MKVSRSAAVCLLVSLCRLIAVQAEEPQNNSTATQDLLRLEQTWNEAHLRGDAATLDRLWSDDFDVVVPKMAAMKKTALLAFVRSGRMKFENYTTSNVQVRIYGDTALVTGSMKRSRTFNGQIIDDNWQFTKVYRLTDGQWRVVHFQASDAPSP
jgi:ketosteroid isomerase-like protein